MPAPGPVSDYGTASVTSGGLAVEAGIQVKGRHLVKRNSVVRRPPDALVY